MNLVPFVFMAAVPAVSYAVFGTSQAAAWGFAGAAGVVLSITMIR